MGKTQKINEGLKNFEGYFGPIGVPEDAMYNAMTDVANMVYTDCKLDFEMFKETINNFVKIAPKCWRKGQAVFNIVDYIFGVAREVQFGCGVDCFYNDDAIDDFITKSYEQYWEHIKNPDYCWLAEQNTKIMKQSIRQMLTACANFFSHKSRFPKFKTKKDK